MGRPKKRASERRSVYIGFRLTKAEANLVKQCRQGGEVFSETARRLLLNGASYAQSSLAILRPSPRPYPYPSTPEPDA